MYDIKIMTDKEFESLPYPSTETSLGIADPKTNTAYVRYTASDDLNKYLIGHELEHLIEGQEGKHAAHLKNGVYYKDFADYFLGMDPTGISSITKALAEGKRDMNRMTREPQLQWDAPTYTPTTTRASEERGVKRGDYNQFKQNQYELSLKNEMRNDPEAYKSSHPEQFYYHIPFVGENNEGMRIPYTDILNYQNIGQQPSQPTEPQSMASFSASETQPSTGSVSPFFPFSPDVSKQRPEGYEQQQEAISSGKQISGIIPKPVDVLNRPAGYEQEQEALQGKPASQSFSTPSSSPVASSVKNLSSSISTPALQSFTTPASSGQNQQTPSAPQANKPSANVIYPSYAKTAGRTGTPAVSNSFGNLGSVIQRIKGFFSSRNPLF